MIILRQKEYSSVGQKVIYGIEKLKGPIDRASLRLSDRIYRSVLPNNSRKAKELDFFINYPKTKPTKVQIMKNAVNKKNEVKKGIGKTLNSLEKAYINPGKVIDEGVEAFIENPASVLTQVGGKVTMITDPTGIGLIPVGAIGTALEQVAKKSIPRYKKLTKKAGEAYKKSKISKKIKNIPSGPELLQGAEQLGHSIGL